MLIDILIGLVIFGYAGWSLVRFINRSKKGKCTGCSVENTCNTKCSD